VYVEMRAEMYVKCMYINVTDDCDDGVGYQGCEEQRDTRTFRPPARGFVGEGSVPDIFGHRTTPDSS
jgi:hypothetical protein